MIETTKIIATHLIKNNFENIVLRVFKENHENEISETINQKDETLIKIINQYIQQSATYQIYKNETAEIFKHSNFDNSYYTHFTSPIRRSIDFYNQYLIINKLNKKNNKINNIELNQIIENYNKFEKNLKKFYRTQNLFDFINKNNFDIIETEAFILKIKKNN